MKAITAALTICTAVMAYGQSPVPAFPPSPTPTADANPAIRHKVTIQIPTKLVVKRTTDGFEISDEGAKHKSVTISVGEKMTTGFETRTFIYPKGEPRPLSPWTMGGGSINGPDIFGEGTEPEQWDLQGKTYVVEREWKIFETDIPPQHMWSPHSSKYKVLLEGKLQQTVK